MENKEKLNSNSILLNKSSVLYWCIGILLLYFFIFTPFGRGLFNGGQAAFEADISAAFIPGAGLLLCLGLHYYAVRAEKEKESVLPHLIWLMPICYLISMTTAASSHSSFFHVLVWMFYGLFFIAAYRLSMSRDGLRSITYLFGISSYIIVIFGFMNWFGDASLWGLFNWAESSVGGSTVYRDAVMIDANGERLTSVFQYANTYAAYLIAVILGALVFIVTSKRKTHLVIAALLMVPAIISFLLTLSRGGLVAIPIVFVLLLPLLSISKQIQAMIQLLLSVVVSVIILSPVTSMGLELQAKFDSNLALRAWLIVIGASIGFAVIALLFQHFVGNWLDRKMQSINDRRFSHLAVPALGIIVAVIAIVLLFGNTGFVKLLPQNIAERLETINFNQHSVLERGTFYQDSIKLWSDYPIIGAGGGAWQALYEKYQNNPYVSRQAHNFFLQTLVEVGVLGFAVLMAILAAVYYYFLRSFRKKEEQDRTVFLMLYVAATSILLHSFIDFNMSYVYIGAIVFFSLGGMLAAGKLPVFPFQTKLHQSKAKYMYPSLLIAASAMLFIVSLIHINAYKLYTEGQTKAVTGGTINEIIDPINQAISYTAHPDYVTLKLDILNQLYAQTGSDSFADEAAATLEQAKKAEPYNKSYVLRELQLLVNLDDYESAARLMEDALDKFPWEITMYENMANVKYEQGYAELRNNNLEAAKTHWAEVFALEETISEKVKQLERLPEAQLQGRNFDMTPGISLTIGQIHFYLGNYSEAEEYVKVALDPNFDEQNDITAAIFYLAILEKMGREDTEWTNRLFNTYPESQEHLQAQIDALASSDPI